MLSKAESIEFGEIQQRTNLSKSALSKHLSHLAEAGYVADSTITRGGRPRLLLSLTPAGKTAYAQHRAALQAITDEP